MASDEFREPEVRNPSRFNPIVPGYHPHTIKALGQFTQFTKLGLNERLLNALVSLKAESFVPKWSVRIGVAGRTSPAEGVQTG